MADHFLFNREIVGRLKRVYSKVNTGELTIILDTSESGVAQGYANDLWAGFGDEFISIKVKLSQK